MITLPGVPKSDCLGLSRVRLNESHGSTNTEYRQLSDQAYKNNCRAGALGKGRGVHGSHGEGKIGGTKRTSFPSGVLPSGGEGWGIESQQSRTRLTGDTGNSP